jgi:8-hydroxy-5-deazaflavin:NADPH oxidoreductase
MRQRPSGQAGIVSLGIRRSRPCSGGRVAVVATYGWNISGVKSGYASQYWPTAKDSVMEQLSRLAVLGAGHVGPVIARLAITAGYPVAIATSGDPDDIALITELVIPGAEPRWASDAAADADIVVLAIPLHRFLDINPGLLNGKLVVDAMNYWPASDGVLPVFERAGSSEIVARRLAGSRVVKALNHIGYHELEDRARPAGAPDRQAAGVAGDDPAAVTTIAGLVDRIGYDPVRLDSLRAGRVLQPGGPVLGAMLTLPEFGRAVRENARSLA